MAKEGADVKIDVSHHYDDQLAWIECFAVINFDLEYGPDVEQVFPENYHLSETEMSSISYLSFPDSNSGFLGDLIFSFRIKRQADRVRIVGTKRDKQTLSQQITDQISANYCPALLPSKNHLCGFAYFRQAKDATNRRGYFQKSLVLLSRYPFFNLFLACIAHIAPRFFEHGSPALETVWKEISSTWPPPLAATPMLVSLFGSPFQIVIPSKESSGLFGCHSADLLWPTGPGSSSALAHFCRFSLESFISTQKSAAMPTVTRPLPSSDLSRFTVSVHMSLDFVSLFRAILSNIQLTWELVLLNQPILVYSSNPQSCSDAVATLVSLIWPLQFAADYRPYFTVHDVEFKDFASSMAPGKTPLAVILGVANPHFLRLVEGRFTVISVSTSDGSAALRIRHELFAPNNSRPGSGSNSPVLYGGRISPRLVGSSSSQNLSALGTAASSRSSKDRLVTSIKKVEERPGIYTNYKPVMKPRNGTSADLGRELVDELGKVGAAASEAFTFHANASPVLCCRLARYFHDLTTSFIAPLEGFVNNSLMPLQKAFDAFSALPPLNTFNADEFLARLSQSGCPQLTRLVKGDWAELYRRFFKTPNFESWFQKRVDELKRHIVVEHLKCFAGADVSAWCLQRHEVEVIDLLMRTRDLHSKLASEHRLPPGLDQKLKSQYLTLARSLPPDTADIVLNSCLVSSSSTSDNINNVDCLGTGEHINATDPVT